MKVTTIKYDEHGYLSPEKGEGFSINVVQLCYKTVR